MSNKYNKSKAITMKLNLTKNSCSFNIRKPKPKMKKKIGFTLNVINVSLDNF